MRSPPASAGLPQPQRFHRRPLGFGVSALSESSERVDEQDAGIFRAGVAAGIPAPGACQRESRSGEFGLASKRGKNTWLKDDEDEQIRSESSIR